MADDLARIAELIAEATAARKCHSCGCFQDAIETLEQSELAAKLEESFQVARSVFGQRRYECLGCTVCWPAEALNVADAAVDLSIGASCSGGSDSVRDGWPPRPGDYRVLRYHAPVAVCALHSGELVQALTEARPDGLSIVGSLQTENLGIERIVTNVTTNPNIRAFILCGEDTPGRIGHFPGQSLACLVANGLDEGGRIIGANGKRPFIRNLARDEVEQFRRQVTIIDKIGQTSPQRIASLIEEVAASNPRPMSDIPMERPLVRALRAGPVERLVLDPAGFVVIIPDLRRGVLVAEHYDKQGTLQTVIEGDVASELIAALIRENAVTRLDHAAYLGHELERAEQALREGTRYVQDCAPGNDEERECARPSCACDERPECSQ